MKDQLQRSLPERADQYLHRRINLRSVEARQRLLEMMRQQRARILETLKTYNNLSLNGEQTTNVNIGGPTPKSVINRQRAMSAATELELIHCKIEAMRKSRTASSFGSSSPSTFGISSPSTVRNLTLSGPSSCRNPPEEQFPHAGAGSNLTHRSLEILQQMQQFSQEIRSPSSPQYQHYPIIKIVKRRQQQQQQVNNLPMNGEQGTNVKIGGPTTENRGIQQSIVSPNVFGESVSMDMDLSNQQDVQSESSFVESILQSIAGLTISDVPLLNEILAESGDMTTASGAGINSWETNAQQNVANDWRTEISAELRELLVKKTIESSLSSGSYGDPRGVQNMHDLESHVRKEESDIYAGANSKFEYYDFLSQLCNKILNS